MQVEKVMATAVAHCEPDTDLGSVIHLMHDRRCGVLPVVDESGRVVGILTDRDVALGLGAADVKPSELSAAAVMTPAPHVCRVGDTVHRALSTMQAARIRRLPVVDECDRLAGLISIDDLVLVAQNVRAGIGRVSYEQAMAALDAICTRSTRKEGPR